MVVTTIGRNQEKYFLYRYSEYRTVDRSDFRYPEFVHFLSIKQYIEQRRKNVEKYMTMESETIKELMDSDNIELNLERAVWWNNNTEPGPSQPTT
jgi:hypothetical protein